MSRQKNKEKNKIEYNTNFWVSIIFLLIMILSIGGFALMSSGGASSSSNGKLPENLAMQLITYNGTNYYISIKNSKQFVFTPAGVEAFNADLIANGIASKIKNSKNLKISSNGNFSSPDASIVLENTLTALKIQFEYAENLSCSKGNLILTNSAVEGDCIQFISSNEEAYEKMTSISYHLVK